MLLWQQYAKKHALSVDYYLAPLMDNKKEFNWYDYRCFRGCPYLKKTAEKVINNGKLKSFIAGHKKKYSYNKGRKALVVKGAVNDAEKKALLNIYPSSDDKKAIGRLSDQSRKANHCSVASFVEAFENRLPESGKPNIQPRGYRKELIDFYKAFIKKLKAPAKSCNSDKKNKIKKGNKNIIPGALKETLKDLIMRIYPGLKINGDNGHEINCARDEFQIFGEKYPDLCITKGNNPVKKIMLEIKTNLQNNELGAAVFEAILCKNNNEPNNSTKRNPPCAWNNAALP